MSTNDHEDDEATSSVEQGSVESEVIASHVYGSDSNIGSRCDVLISTPGTRPRAILAVARAALSLQLVQVKKRNWSNRV